jgi:hypothetical protein
MEELKKLGKELQEQTEEVVASCSKAQVAVNTNLAIPGETTVVESSAREKQRLSAA